MVAVPVRIFTPQMKPCCGVSILPPLSVTEFERHLTEHHLPSPARRSHSARCCPAPFTPERILFLRRTVQPSIDKRHRRMMRPCHDDRGKPNTSLDKVSALLTSRKWQNHERSYGHGTCKRRISPPDRKTLHKTEVKLPNCSQRPRQ